MHSVSNAHIEAVMSGAQVAVCSPTHLKMIEGSLQAGFPSPAEDYPCRSLDLAAILIQHPQATYLVRASGFSMTPCGIHDSDLLVVSRAIRARPGHIVCAFLDGGGLVKYLRDVGGSRRLCSADPTYPDIIPKDGQQIQVWGVVTASITRFLNC